MWTKRSNKANCGATFVLMWSSQRMLHWHTEQPWHLSPFCSFPQNAVSSTSVPFKHGGQNNTSTEHTTQRSFPIICWICLVTGIIWEHKCRLRQRTNRQLSPAGTPAVQEMDFYLSCIPHVADFQHSHIRFKREGENQKLWLSRFQMSMG